MKSQIITFILLFFFAWMNAQNLSGVYIVNKGVNKEQASLYLNQYKWDVAFIYLTYMSGAPDFETFCLKGFVHLHENSWLYSDSIGKLRFSFTRSSLAITPDTPCQINHHIFTKFRKQNATPLRNSTMYIDFVERSAQAKADSLLAYEVPEIGAEVMYIFLNKDELKVIDSYKDFYMVETPDHKKEFLWVEKRNLTIKKK